MRITKAEFNKAIKSSKNSFSGDTDFTSSHLIDDGLCETWYQVDTKEFEYVSEVTGNGSTYYTGSR